MIMLDLLLTSDSLLQTLEDMDRQALLAVNGSDSLYLDRVAHVLTTAITWLPLYISLFYIVLKNNDTFRKVLFIVGCAGLCVLFAGSVDDLIVKPLVGRWRPTHDPVIGTMVDVVDGYRGGRYGFFSAHAANTFSIAVFFCWLIRSRILSIALVIWSFTNCWTRLYLGGVVRLVRQSIFYIIGCVSVPPHLNVAFSQTRTRRLVIYVRIVTYQFSCWLSLYCLPC